MKETYCFLMFLGGYASILMAFALKDKILFVIDISLFLLGTFLMAYGFALNNEQSSPSNNIPDVSVKAKEKRK